MNAFVIRPKPALRFVSRPCGVILFTSPSSGAQALISIGFLVPLGFNEGPGQALSIGKVWEGAGFSDAATIGLTFAAIGYFCAFWFLPPSWPRP
jgi:hypothetical protein